jgi:hypothetical protein
VPSLGKIFDLISPHECSETTEFEFKPEPVPKFQEEADGKFVQKLNELSPSTSTFEIKDQRKAEDVKSSAPPTLLNQLKSLKED